MSNDLRKTAVGSSDYQVGVSAASVIAHSSNTQI